jgi:hypothetical protein
MGCFMCKAQQDQMNHILPKHRVDQLPAIFYNYLGTAHSTAYWEVGHAHDISGRFRRSRQQFVVLQQSQVD